jgi:hypothetical protein
MPTAEHGFGLLLRDLERTVAATLLVAASVGGALLVVIVLVAAVLAGSLGGFSGGLPGLGLLPGSTRVDGRATAEIPSDQLATMRQVAAGSACHLPWTVLAGVAAVESRFGANMGPSSAGAVGYGQFMPPTWAAYGSGNPSDYRAALPAMDRYLCAMVAEFGVGRSPEEALRRALFYYNHASTAAYDPNDAYVRDVLARSAAYAGPSFMDGARATGGLVQGWANRAALNQYDCGNYRQPAVCVTWRDAACSAAALDWLLAAYGVHLGGIDDAITLIGPGTGISTRVGLLDSSGSRLAAAETASGLVPRRDRLGSTAELRTWLDQGPLLLDGHRWFGVGHWFVAIASDDGGIYTRDSSGHDTRYLAWTRLYGEVGWSGWAVGARTAEEVPPA